MTREIHLGDASPKAKNVDDDVVAVVLLRPAGDGHAKATVRNKLSLVPLIFLIFFEVAGGPYGTESAVQSAGTLFMMLAFLIFPFIWAMPESLVTPRFKACERSHPFPQIWSNEDDSSCYSSHDGKTRRYNCECWKHYSLGSRTMGWHVFSIKSCSSCALRDTLRFMHSKD